jgi:hypothetical protein
MAAPWIAGVKIESKKKKRYEDKLSGIDTWVSSKMLLAMKEEVGLLLGLYHVILSGLLRLGPLPPRVYK